MSELSPYEDNLKDEEDTNDNSFASIRKKLFDNSETSKDDIFLSLCKQPVEVCLRIRPKSDLEDLSKETTCLIQSTEKVLIATAPVTSRVYKTFSKSTSKGSEQFIFSHIFGKTASQKEIFDESVVPVLEDFFDGQDCLIFAYGVTNSGKTYTVTGTSTDPGLLPRTLDVIFNSVGQNQFEDFQIKPKFHSEAEYLKDAEQEREKEIKQDLLKQAHPFPQTEVLSSTLQSIHISADSVGDNSNISTLSKVTEEACSLGASALGDVFVHEDHTIAVDTQNGNLNFSIFVSYAEIYNEFIYDLLVESFMQSKVRPSLKLANDRNGNPYIKGLHEVKVNSTEEALQLLRVGLSHRHVAGTHLNYHSSRSHSIFTIKLVRVVKGTRRPKVARVNRISIVDLAGSERSKKTGAKGDRIREAGSINTSLHTLGRCIEAMRHNQNFSKRSDQKIVPFRESKLTQLLQTYFVGKGKGVREGRIVMFVNVSDVASVFDETYHVLKFSALTSKIVPVAHHHLPPLLATLPEMSPMRQDSPAPPPTSSMPPLPARPQSLTTESSPEQRVCQSCQHYLEQIEVIKQQSKQELAQLKLQLWEKEYIVRQQVSQEYNQQIVEIEEKYTREMEEHETIMKEEFEMRLNVARKTIKKQFTARKRVRTDSDIDEEDNSELKQLKTQNFQLKEKLQELSEELEMERNKAVTELKDVTSIYETKLVKLHEQINSLTIKYQKEIEKNKRDNELQLKETNSLKEELSKTAQDVKNLNSKLSDLNKELETVTTEKKSLTFELLSVQEELAATQETLHTRIETNEICKDHNKKRLELEAELADSKKELEMHVNLLEKSERSLSSLQEEKEREITNLYLLLDAKESELHGTCRDLEITRGILNETQLELADIVEDNKKLKIASEKLAQGKNEVERENCALLRAKEDEHEKEKEELLLQLIEYEATNRHFSIPSEKESQTDITFCNKEIPQVWRMVQDQQDDMTPLQSSDILQEKEEVIKSLKKQKEKWEETEKYLTAEVDKLTAERNAAQRQNREDYDNFVCKKEELQNEIAGLKREISQLQYQNDQSNLDLKEKFVILQSEIENERNSKEEEFTKLKVEVEKWCTQYRNEKKLRSEDEITLLESNTKCQHLETQIQTMQEEKLKCIQEFEVIIRDKNLEIAEHGQKLCELKNRSESKIRDLEDLLQEREHMLIQARKELDDEKEKSRVTKVSESVKSREVEELQKLLTEQRIQLSKESPSSVESEHIYDHPPEEPIYDSVHISDSESVLKEDIATLMTKKETSESSPSSGLLDDTARRLPLLERSSQLLDDSMDEFDVPKRKVHYNPLTDAKRKKPTKVKGKSQKIKKEIKHFETDEDTECTLTDTGRRYNLRTRKKATTCEDTDTENDENKTPIKKFTKFLKSKPKSEAPPTRVISATTSKKKKPIRKSQISAPLDYIDTPEFPSTESKIKLGNQVKPARKISKLV